MLKRKNKSIVSLLQDRELNIKSAPRFSSLKIVSQLIRSDSDTLYTNSWTKTSPKEISYDTGHLYFSNYKEYCPINLSNHKPPPLFMMERSSARKRVSDVVSFTEAPVPNDFVNSCQCEPQRCICLSPYILSISEDNWLCQHLKVNGKLIKQIYVNTYGHRVKFKYCDWDIYGERLILTTTRNPICSEINPAKRDVLMHLAVFTTFPIEFYALMAIKRSVFGQNTTAVSISNQSLIIGIGSTFVAIYNFDDFLKGGTLTPYKLGDMFEGNGKVGSYPIGLPLNFSYNKAPPVLFKVKCYGQIVRFGGYPYHYITMHPTRLGDFGVTALGTDIPIDVTDRVIESGIIYHTADTVVFHPDQSNRIIFKMDHCLQFYKIIVEEGNNSRLSKLFTLGVTDEEQKKHPVVSLSSYGRTIKPTRPFAGYPFLILCSDYEDELDIFVILAKHSFEEQGFVLLYDSATGEKLRTVKIDGTFCDSKIYQIYMDLFAIIIIERDSLTNNRVHVYLM